MSEGSLQVLRTPVSGRVPNTSILSAGGLALNMPDQILYSTDGSAVFELGANVTIQHVVDHITVGNATVNVVINSTAIVGGVSANAVTTDGSFVITGLDVFNANLFVNGAVLSVGNSTQNTAATGNGITIGNSSVNSTVNSTAFSGTSANASLLNNQPGSYYTNATNITTGTLPYAQLGPNVVNTTASFVFTAVETHNANLFVNGAVLMVGNSSVNVTINSIAFSGTSANASLLNNQPASFYTNATNITTGTLPYAQLGPNVVNSTAAFVFGAAETFNANVWVNGAVLSIGNTTANITANTTVLSIGNSSVNVTINSTSFSGAVVGGVTGNVTGTAANATLLNNQPGSYYTNATNIATGTLPYAQLDPNVVNTTAAFVIGGVFTHNANLWVNGAVLSVGNTTANVSVNTTVISVGNSSVNVTINSTAFSGSTNATNLTGTVPYSTLGPNVVNTTASFVFGATETFNSNVFVNAATLSVGNSTSNASVNTTVITLGNSTVNAVINSTAASLGGVNVMIDTEGAGGQCQFRFVSNTTCGLFPYNGQYIKIKGMLYAVPSGGVTLANTGMANNTFYLVYAYMSSGTMTLLASTNAHSMDTTAGNIGVEVMTANNSYSLVGGLYHLAGGINDFYDTSVIRTVMSWFNRNTKYVGQSGGSYSTSSSSAVLLGAQCYATNWANTVVEFNAVGQGYESGPGGCHGGVSICMDTNSFALNYILSDANGGQFFPMAFSGTVSPDEGYHYYDLRGFDASGYTTYYYNSSLTGMIGV